MSKVRTRFRLYSTIAGTDTFSIGRCKRGFSRPTCVLDVPILAVDFHGTDICRCKSLVQEMGGRTVARNEDWAFAVGANGHCPFSFRLSYEI